MSKIEEFRGVIRDEMAKYGLLDSGWRFEFDEAKKRLGQCRYRGRVLSFSLPYIRVNEIEVMHNTLLHEIAHALCKPSDGHGINWKRMAARIGAKPQRCNSDPRIISPEGPYKFVCKCRTYYFHRIDALGTSRICRRCKTGGLVVRTGEVFQSATNGKITIVSDNNQILEAMKQASRTTRDIMKELMQ